MRTRSAAASSRAKLSRDMYRMPPSSVRERARSAGKSSDARHSSLRSPCGRVPTIPAARCRWRPSTGTARIAQRNCPAQPAAPGRTRSRATQEVDHAALRRHLLRRCDHRGDLRVLSLRSPRCHIRFASSTSRACDASGVARSSCTSASTRGMSSNSTSLRRTGDAGNGRRGVRPPIRIRAQRRCAA